MFYINIFHSARFSHNDDRLCKKVLTSTVNTNSTPVPPPPLSRSVASILRLALDLFQDIWLKVRENRVPATASFSGFL